MPSKGAVRTLRLPPADFNELQVPRTRQPARQWFRVQRSVYGGVHFGLSAFHRFSHKDCRFPLLYVAGEIDTCLFERFGDEVYDHDKAIAYAIWNASSVTTISVPELYVCDLSHTKTLSAVRVDLSTLMHKDLAAPQEWGLALQKHPGNFEGIKRRSRFNGKACLAVFDRADKRKRLHAISCEPLSNNDAAVTWLDKHKVSLY